MKSEEAITYVTNLARRMVEFAIKGDHNTIHADSDGDTFIYMTWNPETKKKAVKALGDAGLLFDAEEVSYTADELLP